MSAKDFLYSIREAEFEKRALKREQKRMEEQRLDLMDMATSGTGSFEATRVSGSGERSRVESAVCRLIELADKHTYTLEALAAKVARLEHRRSIAEMVIQQIPDRRCRDVLRYRYIQCLNWEEVMRAMSYEKSQSYHIHALALHAFDKAWKSPD